jgi:hypothetical protein
MKRHALSVARYRFRTTFGRRWAGHLALVLLVALVGGLAMGGSGPAHPVVLLRLLGQHQSF